MACVPISWNLDPPRFRFKNKTLTRRAKFVRIFSRPIRKATPLIFAIVIAICACNLSAFAAEETTVVLKDGRTLTGRIAEVPSIAESAVAPKIQNGGVTNTPIVVVDDGLRRTYIHRSQIAHLDDIVLSSDVRIPVWQDVAERGVGVGRVGAALRVTPFDEFGRRLYELRSADGVISVVQGITLITPLYTKVEGLRGDGRPVVWESRINTSSIPRETLSRILTSTIKADSVDQRLQIVRLYMQSERYRDASDELAQIAKDFPDQKDLEEQVVRLRQLGARSLLNEIRLRASAGQNQFAQLYLSQFPSEGVDGDTLQEVRDLLNKYAVEAKRREFLIAGLRAEVAKIGDVNGKRLAGEFANEIAAEINEVTVGRLTSFERLASDASMTPEQKVALAMSGWIVGTAKATENFQSAISLAEVREHVRQYLRDPIAANRQRAAAELNDIEGASVANLAQILKLMKPPLDAVQAIQRGPRSFELAFPGLAGQPDTKYLIQLPPEYDPLRQYPTIVALCDLGAPPSSMLDFWAGASNKETGERLGQATRHGYIVIAADWQQPNQLTYGYSAREHHAVLGALRDASRRFSINPDRVFLTGHGKGGDAVFDIALAHPDLWAGAIPIAGIADRYCKHYWPNGQSLDWYFVVGELDGKKIEENATYFLNRYMRPKFDLTVVEYLGRGYEPFGDELQRLFTWMGQDERRRRMPEEFEYLTMRPWDNYFWWVELDGMPERSMVIPATWPPANGVRPYPFKSQLTPGGRLRVTANQSTSVTVWLSPELVKFDEPLTIEINGRSISRERLVTPSLNVILEDARTRADRQHPFWAKLTVP